MRKHAAALLGTAALLGAAVPALAAAPASATSFSCNPVAHRYVVTKGKAPVHKTPAARGKVIGHVYKGAKVVSRYECEKSDGTWECIASCEVSDNGAPKLYGHWVYRGYLKG
ncbi:hypothetical protein SAMN05216532_1603 [Streptomyces sp. 2231.1]|uniref:hypothetical protein n=1 Tax=Streptomyces sp. 2231.1 TaxID=1855347 RepID=UPI00089B893A|nr:hypothetical protein [Streptomyces sp. 2231.1]SEC51224.1 hypothetical protein SAMN05216532_1603 [Streptomyces sp. 2231.1]